MQPLPERERRDTARDALPAAAARGGQARPLHARRALGRRPRPQARVADLPRVIRRRADGREPPAALRAGRLRARVPDARARHRGLLPGQCRLRARARGGRPLGRSGVRDRVAGRRRRGRSPRRTGAGPTTGPRGYPRDHRRPRARAAGARERPDSRRARRRGLHGSRHRAPDRSRRPRAWSSWRSRTARLEPALQAYSRRGVDEPASTSTRSQSSSRRSPPAGRPSPRTRCSSPRPRGSTRSSRSPAPSSTGRASCCTRSSTASTSILMNAELDGTLGPILKERADQAGVVYTNSDGDQPGVMMNLYRFVKGIGVRPVLIGNVKGLHDPYRNPTTQEGFARQWGQKPQMVTSFADGTKISFEQAIARQRDGDARREARHARPDRRARARRIEEAAQLFDPEELLEGPGIVDYVVGASPEPGRLRARHALAPAPAALPQPLQARRGAALLLLHARTTSATSRCRRRSPGRSTSATPRSRRPGRSRSRSWRRPRSTSSPATSSTASAATSPTAWPRTPTSPPPSGCCPMGLTEEGVQGRARRSARTRCSPTTTSSCPRAGSATALRAEQDAAVSS